MLDVVACHMARGLELPTNMRMHIMTQSDVTEVSLLSTIMIHQPPQPVQ